MSEKLQLSNIEAKRIKQKIGYVLTDKNFHLLRNASTVSVVTAFIPVLAFYQTVNRAALFAWLIGMILVHVGCIGLVSYYKHCNPPINKIKSWKNIARLGVFSSTLMWGSMGILLVPSTAGGENFLLFILIIISASIALGTAVDYISASIGIVCCLLPFIIWQFHEGMVLHETVRIYAGSLLVLYLIFLHIVSLVSYQLIKKSIELSYRNVALASKLSKANSQLKDLNDELEDRVKLRTKELNSALTTVTYQATHDIVTSLPNQMWLLQYVEELINKNPHKQVGIVCLSINNMESITDRYGYYANDTIIKEVSKRLLAQLENKNRPIKYKISMARRDVFVIAVEEIENHDLNEIIAPIFAALKLPVEIVRNEVIESEQLYCSVGVSIYPKDSTSAEHLLLKADTAMFYTKKQYENNFEHRYETYNKEITDTLQYKVQLRKNIQLAIDKDQFYLCYQPLIDIRTGLIVSAEALLRWVHPQTGQPVSPAEIIKVAEEYNLMIPLGEWVLRRACWQNFHWHKLGVKLTVSVNLSAKQLERGDIVKTITQILRETNLSPNFLDLELTETEAFKDNTVTVINNLRDLGVSLSIDDYGQGFSNLSNLKKFSFNKIKIDMEFIKNLPQDVNSQIIVTSSIKMAKALGIKVVAEGVETQEQFEFLAQHGCDLIQGYLFYKPLIAEEITEILINQERSSQLS